VEIALSVNGRDVVRDVEPQELLLDFLRDTLALTGAKRSCDVQVCGACTVLLDGKPVYSCSQLAVWADGRTVQTVEGLIHGDRLDPLQEHGGREHLTQEMRLEGLGRPPLERRADDGSPVG
jgi:aerobic-type carbon monoxide dehydrogenase small subunit (CoxS/CutS family)